MNGFSSDDDASFGEVLLFANLGHQIPFVTVGAGKGGGDEFRADIGLGEILFVHGGVNRGGLWTVIEDARKLEFSKSLVGCPIVLCPKRGW